MDEEDLKKLKIIDNLSKEYLTKVLKKGEKFKSKSDFNNEKNIIKEKSLKITVTDLFEIFITNNIVETFTHEEFINNFASSFGNESKNIHLIYLISQYDRNYIEWKRQSYINAFNSDLKEKIMLTYIYISYKSKTKIERINEFIRNAQNTKLKTTSTKIGSTKKQLKQLSKLFKIILPKLDKNFINFTNQRFVFKKNIELYPLAVIFHNHIIANQFYNYPSIGYKTNFGSKNYTRKQAINPLKGLLSLIRISFFIIKPINTDLHKRRTNIYIVNPPASPVHTETGRRGSLQKENEFMSDQNKIPDGNLWISLGNKIIEEVDIINNFKELKNKLLEEKNIIKSLNSTNRKIILPIINLLDSATQSLNTGEKILLINCCIEHLFTTNKTKNKKETIISGLKLIGLESKQSWFEKLYDKRHDYAHAGIVKGDFETTFKFIQESIKTTLIILNRIIEINNIK